MAVSTGAAILGGSVIGGGLGLIGSKRAADAQANASRRAIGAQQDALERIIGLTAPQRELGEDAVNQLRRVLINNNMADFQASPDFNFRREQGLEGIAQTLGAGGAGAFSGNALRELNIFNSNLAGGEFGDFINRRMGLAGLGQTATAQGAGAIGGAGSNIGNALLAQGNARASGVLGGITAGGNVLKDMQDLLILQDAGILS